MEATVQPFSLVKHVGKERRGPTVFEVELDQWQIMYEGIRVGYVGKKAGSPISMVRNFPDSFLSTVEAYITEKLGKPSGIFQPPPPEVIKKHADDEEEGDDE